MRFPHFPGRRGLAGYEIDSMPSPRPGSEAADTAHTYHYIKKGG